MRPRRAADHSPTCGAAVMEQYSYTSPHPMGHTGPVTASLYHIFLTLLWYHEKSYVNSTIGSK